MSRSFLFGVAMFLAIIIALLSFTLLISADTIEDVTMSDMEGYKVERYDTAQGPVFLAALEEEHCDFKSASERDGYKSCKPTIMVWNKRNTAITIDMENNDFIMDLDIPTRSGSYDVYYSQNYYIYNKDFVDADCLNTNYNKSCYYSRKRVGWLGWKPADGKSGLLLPGEMVALSFRFEIPEYQSANYNFTHIPTGFVLDPPISACGNIGSSGYYTLTTDITNHVGTCFTITADDVTLDLMGHTIDGDATGTDMGVNSDGYDNIVVRNGTIQEFGTGVLLNNGDDHYVYDLYVQNVHALGGVGFTGTSGGNRVGADNITIYNAISPIQGIGMGFIERNDTLFTNINIDRTSDYSLLIAGINTDNHTIENLTITNHLGTTPFHTCSMSIQCPNTTIKNFHIDTSAEGGIETPPSPLYYIRLQDGIIENINSISLRNSMVGGTGNMTVLNVTYDDEVSSGILPLYRMWYYSANTTYTNGTAFQGVNVTAYDNNSITRYSALSDSNGLTPIGNLIEYRNLTGVTLYYNNYTINAKFPTAINDSKERNLTQNLNIINDLFVLDIDYFPPVITINSPNKTIYFDGLNILINITATDNQSSVEDIWFNYNGSNYTYTGSFYNNFSNGYYNLLAWANDTFGLIGFNLFSFVIDNRTSGVSFASPMIGRIYKVPFVKLNETNGFP